MVCSSPLLHPNIANSLGYSGEGQLSQNMLKDNDKILSSEERLNDLMKLFKNSPHQRIPPFVSVEQWNAYWSHCE